MSFNVDTGVSRTTSELARKVQTTNGYRDPWTKQHESVGEIAMTQTGGDKLRQPWDYFRYQEIDDIYNKRDKNNKIKSSIIDRVFQPLTTSGVRINYTTQEFWKCDDPDTDVKEGTIYPVKFSVSATLPRALPIQDANVQVALENFISMALGTFQQNWPKMVYSILTPETLPSDQ